MIEYIEYSYDFIEITEMKLVGVKQTTVILCILEKKIHLKENKKEI